LSGFKNNEDEYTSIIKQLTNLAKDQKVKLNEHESKLALTANIYDVSSLLMII
jgi:hypothetical protein